MSEQTINQIAEDIKKQIELFRPSYGVEDVGVVVEAGDGIARVEGLANVGSQEMVEFQNGILGIAFNLEQDNIGVMVLGDYSDISEGDVVKSTGRVAFIPVGDEMVGRVVNAVGDPIEHVSGPAADGRLSIHVAAMGSLVYQLRVVVQHAGWAGLLGRQHHQRTGTPDARTAALHHPLALADPLG